MTASCECAVIKLVAITIVLKKLTTFYFRDFVCIRPTPNSPPLNCVFGCGWVGVGGGGGGGGGGVVA